MPNLSNIIHPITEDPDMRDPSVSIPMRVSGLITELDDLAGLALAPDTRELMAAELPSIYMAINRCRLIASFIEAIEPNTLRVVGGSH